MSAAKLEADLTAFTESFASLVRSARINEASDDIKRAQAPGEVVEVLAERVVQVAQQLLQSTAELKRKAFLAHAGARLAATEGPPGTSPASDVEECLGHLKAEVARTLQGMPVDQQTMLAAGSERARDEAEHLAHLHRMISSMSSQRRDGLQ